MKKQWCRQERPHNHRRHGDDHHCRLGDDHHCRRGDDGAEGSGSGGGNRKGEREMSGEEMLSAGHSSHH